MCLYAQIQNWKSNFETEIILGSAQGSYSIGVVYYPQDSDIPNLRTKAGKARFISKAQIINSREVSISKFRVNYDRWEPYLPQRSAIGKLVIAAIDRNLLDDELPNITTRTSLRDPKFFGRRGLHSSLAQWICHSTKRNYPHTDDKTDLSDNIDNPYPQASPESSFTEEELSLIKLKIKTEK